MCDRHLDRLLHLNGEEDIRTAIKVTFEPIGDLVVSSCVSGASALEKVPVFNPNLKLIDVISGMDGPASLKTLQKRSETLDISFFFNTPKVQSHEIGGLMTIGAVDAIVEWFVAMTRSDRAPKARACKHD